METAQENAQVWNKVVDVLNQMLDILGDEEAGRAYLCGAFLANGSIRDPESGKYQLEISSVYLDHAQGIASLLQQFLLDAKVIERKKGAVTYLQRAEDIMDFLILVGAMEARDTFEVSRFSEKLGMTSIVPIMQRQLILHVRFLQA